MPEGDTLAKAAARLRPALVGHALTRFEASQLRGSAPALGTEVTGVEARGKHLLIHFADGLTLRTHLRMSGSWHIYRERERWKRPAYLAHAVVGTDSGWVGVCFQAPVVETYRRAGGEPKVLADLGPDLCLPSSLTDDGLTEIIARSVRFGDPSATLGEALLDQRIAAGIGNVYKSEACFACRLDPTAPLATFDDGARRRVWGVAARQLQANLDRPGRQTHPDGVAVYGRRGQPCPTCGTPVAMARHGDLNRSTYWCPSCQPPPSGSS